MNDLERLSSAESLTIAGIEPGNISGRAGAIVAAVEGRGDGTICDLVYYTNREMPDELIEMLEMAADDNSFGEEDLAGLNFLLLHHLSSLYGQIFEETDLSPEDIDLVGLKCIEMEGKRFPIDPADFSEMVDNIVISRFSIGIDGPESGSLPLEESVFRTLVAEMFEEFEFEDEANEALGVVLFANESFRNEDWKGLEKNSADPAEGGSGESLEVVFKGEFFIPSG